MKNCCVKSGLMIIPLFIGLFSPSCTRKLSEEELIAKATEIHEKVLTIDTHCDTPMRMAWNEFDLGQRHEPGKKGSGKIDFPRMAEGMLDASFFASFVGQKERTPQGHTEAKAYADKLIDSVKEACERYSDLAELATSPKDAYRLERAGKRAIFMGMENGYPVGTDLSLVKYFYNCGIRYITLCHNGNNEICDSSTDSAEWNGLSSFGEKVVKEMNRLGMIIDVSHISDSSFYDVVRLSKAPVVASHSCCRALCDHERNMTDDMLKALAKNGGVIQMCLVTDFVKKPTPNPKRDAALDSLKQKYGAFSTIKDPKVQETIWNGYDAIYDRYPAEKATVKDLVDHIDHAVDLVGIDHVGIGTDFDGGGEIEGCDDVTELPNITTELLRREYSEEDIRKIWGGNFMRVFQRVIEVSKKLRSTS